tara:strand:+ start:1030 stop:1362 length:333 start_codon:yes stop_codon:yes gene_type:complete
MIYKKNKENRTSQSSVPLKKPLDNNNSTLRSYDNNIGSGFINSIIQGFALGTGSQLASRTIDSIFGNKKIEIENNNKCLNESELYLKCLENNEKNNCIEFFNLLENCKKS